MACVTVTVRATDPISEIGVTSALRSRAELRLIPADPVLGREQIAAVGVVVTHAVDADTLRLVAALRRQGTLRLVLIASVLSDRDVFTVAEAGVAGIVRRAEATPDRIVRLVVQAAAGEGRTPVDQLGRLLGQVRRVDRPDRADGTDGFAGAGVALAARPRLDQREVDVLRMVADGFDTAQIAVRLCYSERTVKNVLHAVTTRLQLRNRSHAVAFAVREGLI